MLPTCGVRQKFGKPWERGCELVLRQQEESSGSDRETGSGRHTPLSARSNDPLTQHPEFSPSVFSLVDASSPEGYSRPQVGPIISQPEIREGELRGLTRNARNR